MAQSSGCAPLPILATPQEVSSSPIVARMWYLTSCTGTPVLTTSPGINSTFSTLVSNPGCYCLRLWSQNQNGDTCSSSICNIVAALQPHIDFSFTPALLQGCLPFAVNSICNSTPGSGNIDSITIDWGCSSITEYNNCTSATTSHTYVNCPTGCVSPTVIIKNSYNCYADTVYNCLVDIIPDPVASFTADTTTAYCTTNPLLVHFTASITDPNLTYSWYINNSLVQSDTSNLLTYTFPVSTSCYDVKLSVYHPSGCSDSVVRNDYICVESNPQISFTPADTLLCTGQTLVLTNTTPGLSQITWQLSGGTPPQTFPSQTGGTASYTFSTPGTYTVTATGQFSAGCSSTITRKVATVNNSPVVTFTADDTFSCKVPTVINFTTPGCANCTYVWSIGGTNPQSGKNATLTAIRFGTASAQLIATDTATGCSDEVVKNNYINVDRINPQILASSFKGCAPECISLQNGTVLTNFPAQVTMNSICWTFPGSAFPQVCADSISNMCFTTPGCYNVQLTITTNTGCKDSLLLPDSICAGVPPPCTKFTATPDTVCFEADTIQFKFTGCDSISFVKAYFEDPKGSPYQTFYTTQFTHMFSGPGPYCVSAIAYKDSCAGDTMQVCVQINAPVAKFKDSITCATGDTVFLVNQSISATSYLWTFCGGATDTAKNPYKLLPPCDTCTVLLQVYNDTTGCHHQKSQLLQTACNAASFYPLDTSVCASATLNFYNTSPSTVSPVTNNTHWTLTCPPDESGWALLGPGDPLSHTYNVPGVYCVGMTNLSLSGCIDTVYGSVTVCTATAAFGYDTTCFPQAICFHDSSVSSCEPKIWHWDFGDGDTSNLQNPCHAYANTGTYNVKLTISNGTCISSATEQLTTSNIVYFSIPSPDSIVCPGHQLCIQDNSSGANLDYSWYAPGATVDTSSLAAPCFTFLNPIDTFIYFMLSSNHQCSVLDTFPIHAHTPVAAGYATPTYIACPNSGIINTFIDTSKYVDSIQFWSFGDSNGVTVTDVNAFHIYVYPGAYVVTLTVIDRSGCTNSAIIDTIHVSGPFGNVTFKPYPGVCACQDSVHFTVNTWNASTVTLIYGCNQGFAFDSIPRSTTADDTSTFQFAAYYCIDSICTPTVRVVDSTGCPVDLPTVALYADSPTVAFNHTATVCQAGQICFNDLTFYHLDASKSFTVQRLWEFGDGDTSSAPNPCHYYAQPGLYTVKLIIVSNLGCVDSNVVESIIIPAYPKAAFYPDDTFVCNHLPLCFHDTSYIYPLTGPQFWTWNFGDGPATDTVYTRQNCHTYNTPGFYYVTDCVTDSFGCSNCDSLVIHVVPDPVAALRGSPVICYGAVTQLTGTGGISYSWSPPGIFSNPDTSDPYVQLFNDTMITLVVANHYGCRDTDVIYMAVARVTAAFNVNPDDCENDSVCPTNSSTGANDSLVSWLYNFGDSNLVKGPNACNLYDAPGSYNITLKVTDNLGCFDSVIIPVKILPSPDAKFSLNDSAICSNHQVCITDLTSSITPISSWLWNYGDSDTSQATNPPCHIYSPPYQHNYTISLVVTDQNNCVDTSQVPIILNVIPHDSIAWTISCVNDSMPLASASTPGSAAIIFCQWTFWLGAQNPVIDSNCYTYFKFPAGTHTVQLIVRDANGCADTATQAVITDSLTELVVNPGDTTICLGTAVNYTVGGIYTTINWSPDVWISNPDSPTVTIAPLANIEYYITAVNGVCPAAHDSFTAYVIQPVPIEISSTLQESVSGRDFYNLLASIAGVPPNVTIDSIIWTPDSTLSCNNCTSPLATPFEKTTYTATVYYSEKGVTCSNSAQITLDINACNKSFIFVPNTFTPNGDGRNDVLMIRSASAPKIISFTIFDRWDKIVFEATNGYPNEPKWGWNGTDMTGKKLNNDVYVYTYQLECYDGSIVNGQGNVTLLR